ncbi:MAG: ribokinase [Microbacterium sp.]
MSQVEDDFPYRSTTPGTARPRGGRIAVVGSANADLVVDVERRPEPGETLLGSDLVITPGGKGANQAVAAAKAGGDVAFVGCIGVDANGALLRASLSDAEVDLSGLIEVDAPTGTAIIVVTPEGENSIIVAPGANARLSPELLERQDRTWADADVVVLQLEIPFDTVNAAATRARGRVVLNLAPAAEVPPEVLAAADPLVVNESEGAFLLREAGLAVSPDDDGATARALRELGPRSVVLTLGSAGALVVDGESDVVHVPAHKVRAVDTTAAGDAFIGGLAVRLAIGDALADAVAFGSAVAAVAVTRRGAQASYPTLDEIDQPHLSDPTPAKEHAP